MANTLSIISIISFIIAGISFVVAVILWFVFGIPTVIGDLSGRTAKKSIAKIRENNTRTGNKSFRPSATNVDRGKLTSNIPNSDGLGVTAPNKVSTGDRPDTGILAENRADSVEAHPTTLLHGEEETAMLNHADETSLLYDTPQQAAKRAGGKQMVMIEQVMMIHTNEVI